MRPSLRSKNLKKVRKVLKLRIVLVPTNIRMNFRLSYGKVFTTDLNLSYEENNGKCLKQSSNLANRGRLEYKMALRSRIYSLWLCQEASEAVVEETRAHRGKRSPLRFWGRLMVIGLKASLSIRLHKGIGCLLEDNRVLQNGVIAQAVGVKGGRFDWGFLWLRKCSFLN